MARKVDPSWLWGWLWDRIVTTDEPFDTKFYVIAFTTIYILYKTLKAMRFILVPTTILVGNCLVSLAVLIPPIVGFFILLLTPRVFRVAFEITLRTFFSTMWNVWEYPAMPIILTCLAMIRFGAYQARKMARENLFSTEDDPRETTGLEFQYPSIADGDTTGIQPSDTGAERRMRQLVEEDNSRRHAQGEPDRTAEAENMRTEIENKRKRVENERTGLVWESLQSRGPANRQRLQEMTRQRLLAPLRPGEARLAGRFRAIDPVSLPPAHEPAPGPSTAPGPSIASGPSTIPGPVTILGALTVLGPLTVLGNSTAPGPSTTPVPSPAPVLSPAPGPSPEPAPPLTPVTPPVPAPPPAPAPSDTRPIPRGQDIKRAWREGRYNTLGPRRTTAKNASTQTEPTDLASHGTKIRPLELPPRTYVNRGVQTDPVESPVQEEPEAPVVVPELPVPEPSPDPASPEDTQTSLDKGKATEGPEPSINANLVIIHENRAEDEVKEPEYSAVSSHLPASTKLPDSSELTTDAEPESVQTHPTGHDRPIVVHTSVPALLRSTRLPAVNSRPSTAGTSRRNERGSKSNEHNGAHHQSRREAPTRSSKKADSKRYEDKKEKMYKMSMGLLDGQLPSSFKSLETQQVIDTTTTSASVPIYSTGISHDNSKHDIQGSPVVRHPPTPELPLPKTTEPYATLESTSVSNVSTSGLASGAQDDQSEASLRTFPKPCSSVVSTENETFTECQSTTVYPRTERSQQAITEALIRACENVSKETSLLKTNEDGTYLPPASTQLPSDTQNHSVSESTTMGQLPSSPGTSSISILRDIEGIQTTVDPILAPFTSHGYNESDEEIYDDSLDGHDIVENQQESLIGVPETPAARINPQDSDEEMASEPGVSIPEEQTLLASTTDDAQMTDVWRPNEEQSRMIGDAAQDLFKELMDEDDEDSSEDTEPERDLSMSEIANEDQEANLEGADMQGTQSNAPPARTVNILFLFQLPEVLTIQAGMTEEEKELAQMVVDAYENDSPVTPIQGAQPPTDNDDPLFDPAVKATAEQLATRKIAKPVSRAHKNARAAQSTLESVSQGQPHTQPETLQQTHSQVSEDSRNDVAEMDSAARGLLALAAAEGIVVGNDTSNQAVSPSGEDSSHKDTDSQQTDAHVTNSQSASTHETNVQESSISDPEVEGPTVTTLPEEQSESNPQQPQSASASVSSAESQPSPVQSTPTQTPPAQQPPAAESTAAAQQNTPVTNESPTVAGPSNTQQRPRIAPEFIGGLAIPGGNPTRYNPTATTAPTPEKSGPDPEEVAEFNRKKQAQLRKPRQKKPPNVFIPPRRSAPVPSTPNRPQKSPNSSTQGRSPSLTASHEGDENRKAELEVTFGTPGSAKKKQGLQIVDIRDLPDHIRAQMRDHDAKQG
ncbi:hypothetical protein F25303_3349 [Fusarium sp. NRRL 25303]|nr:hypothetical protein F25303_3349 [Fusarium sp. NRRL 25303]